MSSLGLIRRKPKGRRKKTGATPVYLLLFKLDVLSRPRVVMIP
jgi:hypothetical protein